MDIHEKKMIKDTHTYECTNSSRVKILYEIKTDDVNVRVRVYQGLVLSSLLYFFGKGYNLK